VLSQNPDFRRKSVGISIIRPKLRAVSPHSLLLLLLLLLFLGCSDPDGELRAGFESGRYRTVVAFGDSIVEGYRQPEGWPEMLGRDLAGRYSGVRVLNSGISGNTAGDGLKRLQKDVLAHDPDLVLIAFGLNDMKNGVSLSRFQEDIRAMVQEISAGGAQPVLFTTTRLQKGASMLARLNPAPFNDSIRALAEERGIPLIDVNDEFKGSNTPEFLMDAAHPNMEGYRRLTEIIRKGLIGE
jgi:acyl-CoA thioesterase-1